MDKPEKIAALDYAMDYDRLIFEPSMRSLYQNIDFFNVGDWSQGASTLPEACETLVRRHIDPILPQTAGNSPVRILDVGCGLGAGTEIIAKHYPHAEVVGINISYRQIAYARQHHRLASYQVMDASNLMLPNEYFDLAVSVEAAFHFPSRAAFLRSAYRVLKPGSSLIISDILWKKTQWLKSWLIPEENLILNLPDYQKMCQDAGFIVNAIEDITETTSLSFGRYLRTLGKIKTAEKLEKSQIAYILVRLSKPS